MKRILIGIGILLASALLYGVASATMLVENGQPRAQIVIAEQPARMTRLAAAELQATIEKMSVAVHVGENFWSAEVRIPRAGEGARLMDPRVGVDGRMPTAIYTWHFNVGRQRVCGGEVQR